MRSMALAQQLICAGHQIHFITNVQGEFLQRLKEEKVFVYPSFNGVKWEEEKDLDWVKEIAKDWGVNWIITDGYHFETHYQASLKRADLKVMCIDDIAACHYVADIVLNQNISADEQMYTKEDYTKLLLGPEYSLIRSDILEAAQDYQRKIADDVKNVLISMGGADPENMTLLVLKVLESMKLEGLKINVLVGMFNPHYQVLLDACKNKNVEMIRNARSELPELMKQCDVAITAGGSALWEFALFSTPLLTTVIAENQRLLVKKMADIGAVESLGDKKEIVDMNLTVKKIQQVFQSRVKREQLAFNIHRLVLKRKIRDIIDVIEGNLCIGV